MRLPVILFPASDLLLLGGTKRMHLFEPRWVDMVGTSRNTFNSMVGVMYFGDSGDVVPVLTIAEIVACSILGSAGRMVTVRGVARARVRGLTEEVISADGWGLALVEELPELSADDLLVASGEGPDSGNGQAIKLAADLDALLSELDLSPPGPQGSASQDSPVEVDEADSAKDEGDQQTDAPEIKLWTHERVSPKENFASISAEAWPARRTASRTNLAGVPISAGEGITASADALDAVACFYAALGGASLRTRVELFLNTDLALAERLQVLADLIQQKQGMARARRSLASMFSEEESD